MDSASMKPGQEGLETLRLQGAIASRLFGTNDHPPRLGRYAIEDRLGAGAMGTVYRARDPVLQRTVALKLFSTDGYSPALRESVDRLRRESRALASLDHPHVLSVLDVGEANGQVYMAMELAEGGTLDQWQQRHPLDEPGRAAAVVELLDAAADGLCAAHRAGIIHRDVKPQNILLDGHGRVRIADFGLARATRETATSDHGIESASRSGPQLRAAASGTPAYMAPEQIEGRTDAKSDQFSLCATFWEIATGRRPFDAPTGPALLLAVLEDPPRDPPAGVKLPRSLERVLRRGLSKAPQDRFPDLDALRRALVRRPWANGALAFAGLIAVGAGIAAVVTSADPAPRPCAEVPPQLQESWPSTQTAAFQAKIAVVNPATTQTARAAAQSMDRYRDAWAAEWLASCHATWTDRSSSPASFDQRLLCLNRGRAAFVWTATQLDNQDPANGPLWLTQAVNALPALEPCRDGPTDHPPLPDDLRARDELGALTTRIAALRAEYHMRPRAAGPQVLRLEGVVQRTGYAPLQIEWAKAAADHYATVHSPRALDVLSDALDQAQAAEMYEEVVRIAALCMDMSLTVQPDRGAAKRFLRLAQAMLPRIPSADRRRRTAAMLAGAEATFAADTGDVDTATQTFARAVAAYEASEGETGPNVARLLDIQGVFLLSAGEYAAAKAALTRALEIRTARETEKTEQLEVRSHLLRLALETGDAAAAREHADRLYAGCLEVGGPDEPNTILARGHLVSALVSEGKHDEAAEVVRLLVSEIDKLPRRHPARVIVRTNLASLTKDVAERAQVTTEAIDIALDIFGPDSFEYAGAINARAGHEHEAGNLAAAERLYREALPLMKTRGSKRRAIQTHRALAEVLLDRGRPDLAAPHADAALQASLKAYGPDSARIAKTFLVNARTEFALGHRDQALRSLTRARTAADNADLRAQIEILARKMGG